MKLSQRDLAIEIGVSEPTITRLMKALHQSGRPLTSLDAVRVLAVSELQAAGFTSAVATDLLVEVQAEILYMHGHPDRKAWVLFIETEDQSFRLTSTSPQHLAALLDAFRFALVLPLHRIIHAAEKRLERIQHRRVAA